MGPFGKGEGESIISASAVPQCEDTPTEIKISQTDPPYNSEEVFAFNSSSATYVGRVRENPGGSLTCNPIHKAAALLQCMQPVNCLNHDVTSCFVSFP